jgi:hypothetical protein
MVLKDQERPCIRGRDLVAEPPHPGRTQLTLMPAFGGRRIEVQEASAVRIVSALKEPV